MFRLVYKTFHGEPRNHEIHAHESPTVMLTPLVILATLAICAGWVGTPFKNLFEHSMMPVLGHFEEMLPELPHGFSVVTFAIGTCAALAGIGLASIIWLKPMLKIEKLEPAFGWLQKLVENKYYIDEIYHATIIRLLMIAAAFMYWFDKWVIDYLIVNGVGYLTMIASAVWGWFDRTIVDGLVNLTAWITGFTGRCVRHLQTGVAQQYVFLLVAAVVVISLAALGAAFLNDTEAAWIPRISFRF